MSPQTLREALEAVTVWPRTPQVHFTGGEPFLHFPLLLEGVRIAVELGIPCYVETSASWCLDEAEVVERFQALREAGLGAVLIERGPHGLFEMARDRYGYHPLAEGYTGKCHLCVDVRRHLARKGDFTELRPRGFYENI